MGCVLVDSDSGRIVPGKIRFENLLWSRCLLQAVKLHLITQVLHLRSISKGAIHNSHDTGPYSHFYDNVKDIPVSLALNSNNFIHMFLE